MKAKASRRVQLEFDPANDRLKNNGRLRDGLSGVAGLGDTLWLANDETLALERLDRTGSAVPTFGAHTRFRLKDYLRLPGRGEADLEDLDIGDGYLWVLGSHAAQREMPGKERLSPRRIGKVLAKVKKYANRYLLARIPLVEQDATWTLRRRAGHGARKRVAARLEAGHNGNVLTRALSSDELFRAALALPGKENGLDIEGMVVVGKRVLLGLRGPVFNEWSVILEIEPRTVRNHPSLLRLARFGGGGKLYRKHFVELDGLGVRSLCRQGSDILILAGPNGALDGPSRLFRWIGGARTDKQRRLRPADIIHVMDLPTGNGGDHPEAMLVAPSKDGRERLLVVYERAAKQRYRGAHGVDADLFVIPA